MQNLGNRAIKSPESKGEVFVPAWIFPSAWQMHAGKLMRIRTVFVEKTATPSILRSLDSTQHVRISWWFTTSENLCQASYITEKSISVVQLSFTLTPWPFTMTSPAPLLRFMLLTRAETRCWTVMSVSVFASCQTQFWVSLFPVVSSLCWFLVSAACLSHLMLEQHRFFGSLCSLCRTVTSSWPSCLSDWRAELVKQRGGCAHCCGKLMSPSTLASSPLEKRVKIFDDPCYCWGTGCIRITTRSLHSSINTDGVIQTFPWFGCWLFPLLLQFGSLLLITPCNMSN